MGRTLRTLITFLQMALDNELFPNLTWETDGEFENSFSLYFPRFEKKKVLSDYEAILKAYYEVGGKMHKYPGYSGAKAVLQAALKKSIYLIAIPCKEKKLLFRFATTEEANDKRKLLKEKSNAENEECQMPSPVSEPQSPGASSIASDISSSSPSPPLSLASSGYHSEGEYVDEQMQISDEFEPVAASFWSGSQLDHSLGKVSPITQPLVYNGQNSDENVQNFDDQSIPENVFDEIGNIWNSSPSFNSFPDINLEELFETLEELQEKPVVEELNPINIDIPTLVNKKTYWHCKQKIETGPILILIFEKQVIEDESSSINEGQLNIPHCVLKPGFAYHAKQLFECEGKLFYFLRSMEV